MLTLDEKQNCPGVYKIYLGEELAGTVETYKNYFHSKNLYIKFDLQSYDESTAKELFEKLREKAQNPLQAMVSSKETGIVKFILAGGFCRRRRCYETEVSKADMISKSISACKLQKCQKGTPEYEKCRRLLYAQYAKKHERISPITAEFEEFCKDLPAETIYSAAGGEIRHFAFVEENEIAYVGTTDKADFFSFAAALAELMFESFETIFFESDDCDGETMALRSLFRNKSDESYDTYILE